MTLCLQDVLFVEQKAQLTLEAQMMNCCSIAREPLYSTTVVYGEIHYKTLRESCRGTLESTTLASLLPSFPNTARTSHHLATLGSWSARLRDYKGFFGVHSLIYIYIYTYIYIYMYIYRYVCVLLTIYWKDVYSLSSFFHHYYRYHVGHFQGETLKSLHGHQGGLLLQVR